MKQAMNTNDVREMLQSIFTQLRDRVDAYKCSLCEAHDEHDQCNFPDFSRFFQEIVDDLRKRKFR